MCQQSFMKYCWKVVALQPVPLRFENRFFFKIAQIWGLTENSVSALPSPFLYILHNQRCAAQFCKSIFPSPSVFTMTKGWISSVRLSILNNLIMRGLISYLTWTRSFLANNCRCIGAWGSCGFQRHIKMFAIAILACTHIPYRWKFSGRKFTDIRLAG
jgi:hypothetical protein